MVLAGLTLAPAQVQAAPTVPRTVDRDTSLPRIELRGYPFHAETFGAADKPVVIVLHGGPGADHRYLLGLKALADDFHIVFYDQRGTGLSPRVPADQISVQTFIDDLDAFVTAFGHGRPVHLLGHSWGAMLASAYTGQHPGKVDRLVLAEPGFLDASSMGPFMNQGLPELRVIWGVALAWIGKWFVATDGDPYARADWFLQQVMPLTQGANQRCAGPATEMTAWRFGSPNFDATVGRMMSDDAYAKQLDLKRGVDAFKGPALFLTGACNQLIGPAHQRTLMPAFARARLAVVEHAGHFMFNDQPEASLAVVRRFLTEPDS